jgi:phosphoribosylanthranilate isomerase
MIVQIYEIQAPQEAETCIELGVDHLGSVLTSEEAWRRPTLREVFRLTEGSSTRNSLIPLFQDPVSIFKAINYYRPGYIHFCNSLTDEKGRMSDPGVFLRLQEDTRTQFPEIRIIRSIPIPQNNGPAVFPTLEIAREFEPISDIFLTDTWLGKEPVTGYIGITGKTVNWDMAKALVCESKIPVILAGGLSPENVYDALMEVKPAGADSCTQTNQVDGKGNPIRFKKDFQKVEQFVKEVRRAEAKL